MVSIFKGEQNDCFICLKETQRQYTDLHCLCKIYVHSVCWKEYTNHKGWEECPYCHMITIPYELDEENQELKTQIQLCRSLIICIILSMIVMSFNMPARLNELP